MTYTRPWQTIISGNRPKSEMDDAQREIRVDVAERMADLLGASGSWTTDPIVATANTFYMFIHWAELKQMFPVYGSSASNVQSLSTQYGFRGAANLTTTVRAQIKLGVGVNITDVEVSCHTGAICTVACTVYKVNFTTGTVTQTSLASRTIAQNTAQGNFSISSGAGINEVTAANCMYYVEVAHAVQASNDTGIQGFKVTYSREVLAHV